MGSSASVAKNFGVCESASAESVESHKRLKRARLQHMNTLSGNLILIHKFAAGKTLNDAASGNYDFMMSPGDVLELICSLPDADIEGHLDIFRHFSDEDIDAFSAVVRFRKLVLTRSGDGASSTGIPKLGYANGCIYDGMFPNITPLMQAVMHSNLKAVQVLIEFGADLNATTCRDIPYYRSDLSIIPRGASILMIALYKLYDIYDTTHSTRNSNWNSNKWEQSVLVCEELLNNRQINVELGFVNHGGKLVTASAIAASMLESCRMFHFKPESSRMHALSQIAQRILSLALEKTLKNSYTARSACREYREAVSAAGWKNVKVRNVKSTHTDNMGEQFGGIVVGDERQE